MAKFIEEHEELTLINPATPTFRGKSVLDFYLVTSNTAERGVMLKVGPDLHDHNYLLLWINLKEPQRREKKSVYVYKDIDCESFREVATHELIETPVIRHRNMTNKEIDDLIESASGKLRNTMDRCLRKRVVRIDETVPLPEEVEVLLKRRRSALKERRRARTNCNSGWMTLRNTVIQETTYEINKRVAAFENERLVERLR